MTQPSTHAQPPLEFIPPQFNPWVLRGIQTLLPLWMQTPTNISQITGDRIETLAHLYHRFQKGEVRLLLAFRHPSINDPYCMAYLLWKLLPQIAKKEGIKLKYPIHAHFMYDRGIPLWAGSAVGWIYSRLGGTSIQRSKLDLPGLRSARDLLANSLFPLAAAPEGATNGHNELISPLEPGIAQLGFWGVEDLQKAKRNEEVLLVPIGIQYHYLTPPWAEIEQLLAQLEADCGITGVNRISLDEKLLYQRLVQLGERLLSLIENFYQTFYHQTLPEPNASLAQRLQNLLNTALQVSEDYFNLSPKGTLSDRCRRLEQAGWDWIYREEFKNTHQLSTVEKGLGDRIAEEAALRMWHMRIVETFVAVTGYYVQEKPTAERFAETTLLLWDLLTRIQGKNAFFRPQIGKQKVQLKIGEPLSFSARWNEYKSNRRQAVASLTQELQKSLETLIER